ncbi:MAG: ATP-binding protein [Candidatus Jordarchaeales archaeon]
MSSLGERTRAARSGGLVIHVWGEAGSGKTALAARVASTLSEEGFHVIYVSDRLPRSVWGDVERVTFVVASDERVVPELPDTLERLVNPRTRLIVLDTAASLYGHLPRTAKLRLLPLVLLKLKRLAAEKGVSTLLLNDAVQASGGVKPWEQEELEKYADLTVHLAKWDGERIAKGAPLTDYLPWEALETLAAKSGETARGSQTGNTALNARRSRG